VSRTVAVAAAAIVGAGPVVAPAAAVGVGVLTAAFAAGCVAARNEPSNDSSPRPSALRLSCAGTGRLSVNLSAAPPVFSAGVAAGFPAVPDSGATLCVTTFSAVALSAIAVFIIGMIDFVSLPLS